MKKLIEKVKANKFKSLLIGLSVFLLGFVTVNIFNNIGDTYALSNLGETDSGGSSYTCLDSGWKYAGMYNGVPACCPSGYTLTASGYCHTDPTGRTCPSPGVYSDVYMPDGSGNALKRCRIVSHDVAACYACGGSQGAKYVWGDYHSGCSKASQYTTKSSCEAQNNTAQCYYCSATGSYSWGKTKPSKSCSSSWTVKSGVSQTNCNRGDKCYICGGGQSAKYVWGLYGDNGSCSFQSSISPSSACLAKNIKTFKATFNANGGAINGGSTVSCTTTQSNPNSCKVNSPTATKSGHYFRGWSTSSSCSSYVTVSSSGTITLNSNVNLYACYGTTPPEPAITNPQEIDDSEETVLVINTRELYEVTYDLNGGKFIDGTTDNRVTYVYSDEKIGDPKTNPIKDGVKFKEWQLDGTKFDFGQQPTKDITLKAVYEDLTDEDKLLYCEDNDILDISTKTCYNVMKLDESKALYNYTLYSYAEGSTFCYAYNATTGVSGGIFFKKDLEKYETIKGKDNADYSQYGYDGKDAWISKDTCKVVTKCTEDSSTVRPACEIRWDAIIYSSKNALIKQENFSEDGTDILLNESVDSTNEEIPDSPKTGNVLIVIAYIIGIGALTYAIYYFRKVKRN